MSDNYTRGRISPEESDCGWNLNHDLSQPYHPEGPLWFASLGIANGEADARRMAACWNACEEVCLTTGDLEDGALQRLMREVAEAREDDIIGPRSERDTLLAITVRKDGTAYVEAAGGRAWETSGHRIILRLPEGGEWECAWPEGWRARS